MNTPNFPVDQIKDDLLSSLDNYDWIVLKSSPGSGKTTRVPVFLTEKFQKKIYILEPRRLAAKLAANFVAKSLKSKISELVGYIFRFENKTTEQTRLIFLTEGTFLKILKNNLTLSDTDVVILDEFHERHMATDMALSFLIKIKETNPSLKIIIMSATLDSEELERFLNTKVKSISVEQKRFPITIHHLENNTLVLKDSLEKKVLDKLEVALNQKGHILIFLPGMSEIRRVEEKIKQNYQIEPLILHGDLGMLDFEAINFDDLDDQKIILATNIAESSVTIPGVHFVIDSGLTKTATLHPITRMKEISLTKASQSSCIQRAYRSNRNNPGTVFRLYPELDFLQRAKFDTPEINRTDLSDLILASYELFGEHPDQLKFLESLNDKELKFATNLLIQNNLIENNSLTKVGLNISKLPFGSRLSVILYYAHLYHTETANQVINFIANWLEARQADQFKRQVREHLKADPHGKNESLEKIMLMGFSDQIGKIRSKDQLEITHRDGHVYKIAKTIEAEIDPKHELWIILSVNTRNEVDKMLPIEEVWLFDLPYFPIEEDEAFTFNTEKATLQIESITKIGSIILSKSKSTPQNLSDNALTYLSKLFESELKKRMDSDEFNRLHFLESEKLKIESINLNSFVKNECRNFINGDENFVNFLFIQLINHVKNSLDPNSLYDLESDLPLEIKLSDKRKVKIHYDITNGVWAESYIQDFYGLKSAPTILKGKEKLKLHLLGPHKRALQVTTDLTSFWNKTYKEMIAELKREYPRHYWPENPESAKPILLLRQVT